LNAAFWDSTQSAAFGFKIVFFFFLGIRIACLTRDRSRRRSAPTSPFPSCLDAD
jgi:hypothetical protein